MYPFESLGVPLVPKSLDTLVELFRFTRYVERNKVHFATKISLKSLSQTFLMFGPLVDKQHKRIEQLENIKFSLNSYTAWHIVRHPMSFHIRERRKSMFPIFDKNLSEKGISE